jgi:hypothetical protein
MKMACGGGGKNKNIDEIFAMSILELFITYKFN